MTLSIQDKVEMQELMARFALAVDMKEPDKMQDFFVEEGEFLIEAMDIKLQGTQNIISWIKENADSFPPNLNHVQSNFVIDGDSSEARLQCISQAIQTINREVKPFILGRYDETLVKTQDGWRLKVHKLVITA